MYRIHVTPMFPCASIEDAKQKSEYDKMIALAEKKKATVRLTINEMRYDFKKLLKKNLEIPDHLMLRTKVGRTFISLPCCKSLFSN